MGPYTTKLEFERPALHARIPSFIHVRRGSRKLGESVLPGSVPKNKGSTLLTLAGCPSILYSSPINRPVMSWGDGEFGRWLEDGMPMGIGLGVLLVVTAFGAITVGTRRIFASERAKSRSPFTEKMLRPPGESLRLRLDDLRFDLLEAGMLTGAFLIAPGVIAMPMDLSRIVSLIIWAVPAAMSYAAAAVYWRKFRSLRESVRNYRLGF